MASEDQHHRAARGAAPTPSAARVAAQHARRTRARRRGRRGRGLRSRAGRSSRAHIIGVVVSDTTSEIRIATDSVTANSRNSRPTMPPISRIGMNTATSDTLIDSTVKPTSRAPRERGLAAAACPRSMWRDDVLQHDDRVVDDEAGRDGQRHQRQVVEAVAGEVHDAERADQRHRHRDARDQRRAPVAQEQEHHQDHQRRSRSPACARPRAARRGSSACGPSRRRGRSRAGIDARSCGSSAVHAVDGLDDVGVRLAVDDQQHRRLAVGRAGVAQVLHRVDDLGRRRSGAPRAPLR